MNKFDRLLKKIDSFAPDPWIVEGTVQVRPVQQLGFFIGVIIGLIVCLYFF